MIERNLDTAESRAFWKSVDEGAAEIRKWPLWKREQGYWSMHCPMCHNNMIHRTGEACCGHWSRPLPDWMTDEEEAVNLTSDSDERKNIPLARGLLDYFPAALAAVAHLSQVGNEKHNPGEPLHHARGKSSDHADCIMRHLMDRGHLDTDGISHSVKVAWRALAMLQEELEALGAPLARGARLP